MVGYDSREKESSLSESTIAGGLSGAITRLVLQPLDVIKTRFQVICALINARRIIYDGAGDLSNLE